MIPTFERLDKVNQACLIGFAVFSVFSISLTQICATVGAICWLIRVQATQSWRKQVWPLGWIFLGFALACILAVLTSVDPAKSAVMLKKILLVIIFFWVANSVREAKNRDLLVIILLISAGSASLYGISQGIALGVSKSNRVDGTMSIYMTFAGVLMLVSLVGLSRLIFRTFKEWWMVGITVLMVICLLLTLTRQAWLGLFAGVVFLIFIRQWKWLTGLATVMGLMLLFSTGAVKERILSMADFKDSTLLIRLQLWQGGWEIFKDHPISGCGFKCVDKIYADYPEQAKVLQRYKGMHNNMIQMAVDAGIIGLTAWIAIWIGFFYTLYSHTRDHPDRQPRWIVMGSAGAVIGFLAGGFFEVNFYDSEVIMLLYFLMGLPFTRLQVPEV